MSEKQLGNSRHMVKKGIGELGSWPIFAQEILELLNSVPSVQIIDRDVYIHLEHSELWVSRDFVGYCPESKGFEIVDFDGGPAICRELEVDDLFKMDRIISYLAEMRKAEGDFSSAWLRVSPLAKSFSVKLEIFSAIK